MYSRRQIFSITAASLTLAVSGHTQALDFTTTTFPLGTGIGAEAVAVLDFDGDGDLDLAIGNPHTGHQSNNRVVLLANDGQGGMSVHSLLPLLAIPTDLLAADLDGDGDEDLVVGAFSPANSISVLLNDGVGGFGPRVDTYVSGIPTRLALGDLDGDGDLDLAVTLRSVSHHHVGVILNNGNGGLGGLPTMYPVGGGPDDVTLSDLDGDGDLDAVSVDYNSDAISVLLNPGTGAFGTAVSYPVGSNPTRVAAGDIDGDGDFDLAVSNQLSPFVSLLMNDGSGAFPMAATVSHGLQAREVLLEDLDGDGVLDLALGAGFGTQISVRRGLPGGGFDAELQFGTAQEPRSIVAADLNGDGALDLVTANDGLGAASASVFLQNTPLVPGVVYCTGTGCPCGNDAPGAGCGNSSGGGALLGASGTASVASDDLVLQVVGVPSARFGLIFMGGAQTLAPFGDGLRCVAGGGVGVHRFPVQRSGPQGVFAGGPGIVAQSQSFVASGHISSGSTWNFQAWFRDVGGPCSSGFNTSNGLAVAFLP